MLAIATLTETTVRKVSSTVSYSISHTANISIFKKVALAYMNYCSVTDAPQFLQKLPQFVFL